ncbi:hypothetical protein PCC7424_3903 [Gloeothece citriformis PCC 7424]|uniref:Uncharacterized protein n=1 Tax=Gloeothece citriformis (strain PCC 7424) TaxID=65393 RepID=B7KKE8_GLOC7|nr:hypothetical protein [Gloeothece citriformis]ACK72281.1 hypothetical protein PCC7424_3903 [Gloeothece citriformis PCC 7424]
MNQPIEQAILSKREGQDLFKIGHQNQWSSYLRTIGLNPDEDISLSWENIEDLLALQLFIQAQLGQRKGSKAQFAQLYKKGKKAVLKTLYRLSIPWKSEKKKLRRRYQTQILPKRTVAVESSQFKV